MKIITSTGQMQRQALRWRQEGKKTVLVPTMGALHQGHLSLVRRARRAGDIVVMSIYVNPTQFGPAEDFHRYPRPFAQDRLLAQREGVDVLFHPENLHAADASTGVTESSLSQGRCGAGRPGHFDGVCTVVLKLFNLVQPFAAVFGQKDAQQCDVIERMVRDLDVPVKIIRAPLLRDARGVALSSRNAYLTPPQYETAVRFAQCLRGFSGVSATAAVVARCQRRLQAIPDLQVEYVECAGGRLCAAVRVGTTRLIDNVPVAGNARSGRVKPNSS